MSETTTDYRAIAHELLLATLARMEKFPKEPFRMAGAFAIPHEHLGNPSLRRAYIDSFVSKAFSTRTLSPCDLTLRPPTLAYPVWVEGYGSGIKSRMLATSDPVAQQEHFIFTALTDELVPA